MEGHKDISEMSFEEFFSEKDRSPVQQEPRVRRDAPRRSGGGQKGDVQMGFGAVIPKINYSDRSFFLYVPRYGSDANARFEVAIDCSAGVVPLGRLDSSPRGTGRLSRAAMEILAIIAYGQPITRGEIEKIRGVGSDTIVKMLRDREYIMVKGRKNAPGHPWLYHTTKKFLHEFNLKSIQDLPKLSEIDKMRFEDKMSDEEDEEKEEDGTEDQG